MKTNVKFYPQIYQNNSNPIIISVFGPKKAGKTTLIKSLSYYFSKKSNEFSSGPLIITKSGYIPLIFIECPLDTFSIATLSKATDIAILVIDGFFGLELETFECLSFLNTHGTPRILSVITHIDLFLNWKNFTKTKKRIKNRLKKELGKTLKFFFFSGLTYSDKYVHREIANLTRFFTDLDFYASNLQKRFPYFIATKIKVIQKYKKEYLALEGIMKGKNFENLSRVKAFSPGIGMIEVKNFKSIKLKNCGTKKQKKIHEQISTQNNRKKFHLGYEKKKLKIKTFSIKRSFFFLIFLKKKN